MVSRHYDVDAITRRVQQLATRIRPVLAERGSGRAADFNREVEFLIERIAERGEVVNPPSGTFWTMNTAMTPSAACTTARSACACPIHNAS